MPKKFSVTDIQVFKRCRRKWKYSSNTQMNLTRVGMNADYLELGSLIHNALALWMTSKDSTISLPLHFSKVVDIRVEQIKQQYYKRIGANISDQELQPYYEAVSLGLQMCSNYQEHWGAPLPANMTFAAAEQELEIPVPGTEHQCPDCINWNIGNISHRHLGLYIDKPNYFINPNCTTCSGTGYLQHILTCTLDGLLQNKRGLLFVLERKTFDYRYTPTRDSLKRADQFTGYCWALREVSKVANIGKVAGIAYDGLKKLAKPSRGKSLDDLFIQTIIPKSDAELDAWGINIANVINEMANNPTIYPNIPWNGCERDCAFMDLCDAQLEGQPIDLLVRQNYTQRETFRIQGIREGLDLEV